MRLGVYADVLYSQDDLGVSAPQAFVTWVTALGEHFEEVTVYGRVHPAPARAPFPVSGPKVRFVPLPYYEHLRRPAQVLSVLSATLRTWRSELGRVDTVLLFGPHPVALLFGMMARRAGIPVVTGVRQDLPRYVRSRVRGPARVWAVPSAHVLERAFARLARSGATIVVGAEMARRYRQSGRQVLETGISLVRETDLTKVSEAIQRPWPGEHTALAVGRIDPEKNPLLLVDILAALRRTGPWTMRVAGEGSLSAQLEHRASKEGLSAAMVQVGMVDGATLRALYRSSSVFVHVSWTEGLPQVLFEAAAAGLPIVATSVGGVAEALAFGRRGMLVKPGDAEAVATAVNQLGTVPDLRRSLVTNALDWVRNETIDAQTARAAQFISLVASSHHRVGER